MVKLRRYLIKGPNVKFLVYIKITSFKIQRRLYSPTNSLSLHTFNILHIMCKYYTAGISLHTYIRPLKRYNQLIPLYRFVMVFPLLFVIMVDHNTHEGYIIQFFFFLFLCIFFYLPEK